jgi:hypothetical protein
LKELNRFALLITALLISLQAPAIVMRHDVPEQRFIELASRYPAAVNVRPANADNAEGTLIAPRWVLTAAHVASAVVPGDLIVAGGKSYRVERVFINPGFHELRFADMPYDIALIRLELAVTDIQPVLPFNGHEQPGSVVTFVGRGGFGTGIAGIRGEDGSVRAATNRIDAVTDNDLQFRFDKPGEERATELEGISGPGDSGGAAFQEIDGKLYVVGVSSWQDTKPTGRVQGVYGVIEHYVRVSPHYEWLTRTMRAAP